MALVYLISFCMLNSIMMNMIDASPLSFNVRNMEIEYGFSTKEAQNCGDVPFKLSWSPDKLSPFGSVTINFEYSFPVNVTSGFYNASAYYHGDKEPFIGVSDSFGCKDIKKFLPCPINAGYKFTISKTFNQLNFLGGIPGDYDVRASVLNQDKKPIICIKANIVVWDS